MKRDLPEQRPAWLEYERRKAEWKSNNPNATPDEYAREMVAIAKELEI